MRRALHLTGNSSATRWTLAAGLYTYAIGTVLAFAMDEILGLFGEVIGLTPPLSLLVFGTPALVVGAATWWVLVERPATYGYLRGGAFGLLTALITGLVWTARFVTVWGAEMLVAGPVPLLVGFVLIIVCAGGLIAGLPFTFARRRTVSDEPVPGA